MTVHELSRADARRLAVRAQLLTRERPAGLLDLVRHLTVVQNDPTAAVAPSAHLVCWSRLGSAYSPDELTAALDEQSLVEHRGMIRPVEDLALHRADMADWPGRGERRAWQTELAEWVEANGGCRQDILDLLRTDGPLPISALPDTCEVPWRSTGWTNNKNVQRLVDFMVDRGEVAVVGREGRERLVDLASRVFPDDDFPSWEEALRQRNQRRLRSLGIARAKNPQVPGEPYDVGETGERAVIEGVKGEWRIDPALLDEPLAGRTALLSPLDRLVLDRKRVGEIFDFDYQLEMYKPAAARRWGYYALPILHGDQLVGKVDATSEHAEGVLRVDAVHEDAPFSADLRTAVRAEIADLAGWLGLEPVYVQDA